MSAAPPPNPANQMPEPPRQKRAYTKRGTGATAMKKQKALKGGLSKMYQGRAARRATPGAGPRVRRDGAPRRQLCGCSDERVALKCVNLLLVITRELEVPCLEAGDFYDDESPLLNGLATMLDRCLPPGPLASSLFGDPGAPPLEDDVDPWAWRTASNRSAIAHHDRCLRHVLVLLEPPLLGLESATLCADALASVGRHVELGGAFLESRPLRHYLARGGGGAKDDALKNGCALAGIAPPARARGRRRRWRRRAAARDARAALLPGRAPVPALRRGARRAGLPEPRRRKRRWRLRRFGASAPMERYAVRPGATLREGGRDAARAHQRHVALRALETLAAPEFGGTRGADETPADAVRLSAERLARVPRRGRGLRGAPRGARGADAARGPRRAPVAAGWRAPRRTSRRAIVATHVKYLDAPTAAAAAAAKPAPAPAPPLARQRRAARRRRRGAPAPEDPSLAS
ncbi:hypothetical protein JL722_1348 [Aureococcus anophagefferens]|nr:hypothetical protein JL722_1348 [Aureococcus anophagefferens]